MTRRAHLVGTWPGRDPEHAMEAALKSLAPYLVCITDGETGDRNIWGAASIDSFRVNPDVTLVRDGNWTAGYEDTAQFRVREGVTLDPDNIRLGYALAFQRSFHAFTVLRERCGRPDLRFQVGIPTGLDLAFLTFGQAAFEDASIVEACTVATVREIEKVYAEAGDDVVFQLETPMALIAVAMAPSDERQAVTEQMARMVSDLAGRAPASARFGIHLCLGDLQHKAFAEMSDAEPLVLVANALAEYWPDGRPLDFIHAPFAAADEPPIPDVSFYESLRNLRLPDEVRFIAGFLHERLDHQAHKELLDRIEELVGRKVDIAAACGLGRRATPEDAFEAMRETRALIEESESVSTSIDARVTEGSL